MATKNVKTAFRLPSGVNQDYQKFNMAAAPTTPSTNINQQQQNMK